MIIRLQESNFSYIAIHESGKNRYDFGVDNYILVSI